MEIDEIDGNEGHDGHIYHITKLMKYRKYSLSREINKTNLVQIITEELILLV